MSVRQQAGAWRELFGRYRDVWRHCWKRRHRMTLPAFNANEAEFLPAALSVQAAPVSPAGRWVARILILLVTTAIVWSYFGKIDIVVDGGGKIIPASRTKTLAAVEVASVRALHVRDGQVVKTGDALIDLDTRVIDAERQRADGDRLNAVLQAERARALIDAIDTGRQPRLADVEGVSPERRREVERHLLDQWRDFVARRNRFDGEIRRYGQAAPLAARRADDYAELMKSRDVAEHAWIEAEQQRIDAAGQLADARHQRAALVAETRRNTQDALNDAQRIIDASAGDVRRAEAHGELLRLTAPIDGTVQQLAVHTIGTAVPAAQPLMQIVPRDGSVEMEAFVDNRDIGFVKEGQAASVKIDAFEYTKYGTLSATVSHVSRDAIDDEKKGLVYSVRVVLDRSALVVDGRKIALSPGMSGSAEIRTGTRRVIEYVLSPLLQHARESLRER
ncbi:HlyD family type I secretion periplasmic adaptor subunit [Burkholderia sp. Ac-20345]|uniref:HlyD family type I secretion periplasmic adaptor subunit n=1 Tax=Burkholderia sp. Ac-20345 TaxID=2703891 RepID=UPI00197C0B18|nr:HlyD family type I secretion periplasmic adaptor subunit [Burkholderia sp. Ac-20345]MBN3781600.1 HlyD family type I secretion periplasmic adaptor subunit [Burkholderia sp. Ac-20345]